MVFPSLISRTFRLILPLLCCALPFCFEGEYGNPLDTTAGTGLLFFNLDEGGSTEIDGNYMFFTDSPTNGTLGGPSGADSICNSDPGQPRAGTYKAFLVDAINNRRASLTANAGDSQTDWVLAANTNYYRSDNTFIATSNSVSLLPDTLAVPLDPTQSKAYWTAILTDWTVSGNNCGSWLGGGVGTIGDGSTTSNMYLDFAVDICTNTNYLLCVEQ